MFILPILDEELFKEILQYFYEDHLQDGEKLQLAININDIKTAKNITHTLKGVASSIGAMTLYEHAKALDFSINEQQTDQYQALFSTLKDELDKVIASIRHSAAFLGINFLIDAAHAINDNTVPLLHIED